MKLYVFTAEVYEKVPKFESTKKYLLGTADAKYLAEQEMGSSGASTGFGEYVFVEKFATYIPRYPLYAYVDKGQTKSCGYFRTNYLRFMCDYEYTADDLKTMCTVECINIPHFPSNVFQIILGYLNSNSDIYCQDSHEVYEASLLSSFVCGMHEIALC